jgi:5-carboxymethyl-2-hydroxymuconate isomerase
LPHMSIEYSGNLDASVDMAGLCKVVLKTILDTGLFEVGAVRVRAFRSESYAVADQLPQNGFIDMNFRIGKGRSETEKKRAGEAIFANMVAHLNQLFENPHFALSLEIREIDEALSWKKNAIHPRLRTKEER